MQNLAILKSYKESATTYRHKYASKHKEKVNIIWEDCAIRLTRIKSNLRMRKTKNTVYGTLISEPPHYSRKQGTSINLST